MRRVSSRVHRSLAVAALVFAVLVVSASQASAALTVDFAGAGTGSVTSDPAGINCSNTPGDEQTDCVFEFAFFSENSFTATADPPYVFKNWSGTNGVNCNSGSANPCSFAWVFGGAYTLTATFEEAPDPPVATTEAATGLEYWGATLNGQANPNSVDFAVSGCEFEWGTTSDYGQSADCVPGSIPAGTVDVAVHAEIGYLQPDTTYHYRLAATNAGGTDYGQDQTFTTTSEPQDDCDNAAIRAQQPIGVTYLPDCMAYELVSNGDSWGQGINVAAPAISDDGRRAMFLAQTFGQPEGMPSWVNAQTASRGPDGWDVRAMTPDPDHIGNASSGQNYQLSADLGSAVWPTATHDQRLRNETAWELEFLDGSRRQLTDFLVPLEFTQDSGPENNAYELMGGAPDLDTVAFRHAFSPVRFFSDEPLPIVANGSFRSNLYALVGVNGGDPEFVVVNRDSNPGPGVEGPVIGGVCGSGLGGNIVVSEGQPARRAISENGSVVYFTAALGSPTSSCSASNARLFKRVDFETTVQVSASQCDRVSPVCAGTGADVYRSASADGSVVTFTSSRQLTNSDLDTAADVYVYDADPPAGQPNLVQASAGEAVGGHSVGSGAGVTHVLDMSADGSRTYFIATGVLAGVNARGAAPTAGQRNLYVFERDDANPTGRIAFVGTTQAADIQGSQAVQFMALPANDAADDGRFLLFGSAAALVAGDDDTATDVYRYDDSSDELLCLSCAGDGNVGVRLTGIVSYGARLDSAQATRTASADASTVVFGTAERLVPEDRNAAPDAYVWRDGELTVVSAGTGDSGSEDSTQPAGVSLDGESVFFTTRAALVGSDRNGQVDMYVARVGGGFLLPPPPVPGCDPLAAGCPGPGADAVDGTRETASPPDAGNAAGARRVRLALGRVSRSAARRAARRGVLAVRVRLSDPGRVRVSARARVGGRVRRVGIGSRRVGAAGPVTVRLRLSRPARRVLARRGRLTVRVAAAAGGARQRSMTVRLLGARS